MGFSGKLGHYELSGIIYGSEEVRKIYGLRSDVELDRDRLNSDPERQKEVNEALGTLETISRFGTGEDLDFEN